MKTQFTIKIMPGKQPTKLEAHLVNKARSWASGNTRLPLDSLSAFYNALQSEKQAFCATSRSARVTSVRIMRTDDCIQITSAEGKTSAIICLALTPDQLDQKQVQDSLLIPLRP